MTAVTVTVPTLEDLAGADAHYIHTQSVAADVWTIVHNLGKNPSVQIFDSTGREVEGQVEHIDNTTVRATFTVPFAGVAYLN